MKPIPVQLDGDPGGYVLPDAAASPADGSTDRPAGSGNGQRVDPRDPAE